MHNQPNQNKLNGVSCSVSTCTHHGPGNICCAKTIKVGTEYAESKAETFCSTFENKTY
ncbi:MAG: DUF1540 domain-containing protein [Oscillospiraceae bacterium]|nr:DUF1540 domain-containing protein [Oscillospiraceae bacterium]